MDRRVFVFFAAAAAALSGSALDAADVVASGLNNPRGIAFGPDDGLYVAEAGTGGPGVCVPSPEGPPQCFGTSGSVTRIDLARGKQERIATGFPSLAATNGDFALGPHDISFQGLGNGFITIGLGHDPAVRAVFGPAGSGLANLARMVPNGHWNSTADIGAFETLGNPHGDALDTNPYGLLALPGKQIVADAGGNDLLEIRANGTVRLLAVFANRLAPAPPFLGLPPGAQIPTQVVPTTVIQAPDGGYYVGGLTGFPFPPGGADIYHVPAEGGTPTVAWSGFTSIIDIAIGPDGSLYVLEFAKNGLLSGNPAGALIRVFPDGTRAELAPSTLFFPGGITVGSDGALYATNWSILAGGGQVLRIVP